MTLHERAREIVAKLIAQRYIHRSKLRDMFLDEDLFREVEQRLSSAGLELATNVYSEFVTVRVAKDMENTIFSDEKGGYRASNTGLSRGALALLTIIWAKIVMPKRQMQIERRDTEEAAQEGLWQRRKPIPKADDLVALEEKALLADFAEKLGGKTLFYRYLAELARADFIIRRGGRIYEGPLLDVAVDYGVLAPRIIEGALSEILSKDEQEEKQKQ